MWTFILFCTFIQYTRVHSEFKPKAEQFDTQQSVENYTGVCALFSN